MLSPILLIEDDPGDASVVRRTLSACRIPNELVVIGDGGDALDYLFGLGAWQHRDVRELPALVLLDLALPTIDGLEIMRQIRAEPLTRLLPVVILTASREQADVLRAYGAGASGYVVKPRDLGTFGEAVRELGHYWLHLNASATPPFHATGTV